VYQKTLKHSCVALWTVRSGKFFIVFQVCMYSASLVLSVFRAQGLQWDVPAHAGVLCDKAVLPFVAMKDVLYTHAGSCSVLWILTHVVPENIFISQFCLPKNIQCIATCVSQFLFLFTVFAFYLMSCSPA